MALRLEALGRYSGDEDHMESPMALQPDMRQSDGS